MTSIAKQIGRVRADVEGATRSGEFIQLAKHLMGSGPDGLPGALAQARQAGASDKVQNILRSAVAIGSTANTPQLIEYQQISAAFLETLRHASAFEMILSNNSFRRVPFKTRTAVVAIGAAGARTAEGESKPVSRLTINGGVLDRELKATVIVAVSAELLRFSGAVGSQLLAGELRTALAVEVDAIAFAELLTTSTPQQPSAGGTADDALADLGFLFDNVTLTASSAPYFVSGSDAARSLALRHSVASGLLFDGLGPTGGEIMNIPLLISDGVDPDVLILLDAHQVVAADAGIVLGQSRQATLALDAADPTVLSSLWAANMVGLRAERLFAIEALGPNAIASVSGIGAT